MSFSTVIFLDSRRLIVCSAPHLCLPNKSVSIQSTDIPQLMIFPIPPLMDPCMEAVDAPIMAGCMSKIVLALSTWKQTKMVGLHLYPRTQGIR